MRRTWSTALLVICIACALAIAGCGSGGSDSGTAWYGGGNSGGTAAASPRITEVSNMDLPGQPIRVGDWIQIQGSGFGTTRTGTSSDGYVTFSDGATEVKSVNFGQWTDMLIECQVPQGAPIKDATSRESVVIHVVKADATGSGTPYGAQANPTPNPSPQTTPPGTSSHDNNILFFVTGLKGSDMSFTPTGHIVTGGQPWNGITSGPGYDNIEYNIDIFCGRKGSNEVGEWFRNWSSSNNGKSIDGHNASVHDSMNFAVTGVMVLQGTSYNVCLAQYGYAGSNIWVVCGSNFSNLQGTYSMDTPDGKYNFSTTNQDSAFNITLNN